MQMSTDVGGALLIFVDFPKTFAVFAGGFDAGGAYANASCYLCTFR